MNEERGNLVRYRLEQADHALRQAEILAQHGEWSGVVNRAYYAMFYAALALLLTKDLGASKHSGVLALMDREFVRTGEIPAEISMMLRDAFNQRQKADYAELAETDEVRARELLKNARDVEVRIRAIIMKSLDDGKPPK